MRISHTLDNAELTQKKDVDYQNKLQVKHSHRQVYSPEGDFKFARELIEKNPEYADTDYSFPDPD